MGVALADEAARAGWEVVLLLGPVAVVPSEAGVRVMRFRTCEDLRVLLDAEVVGADVLVMAAAVADYRPKVDPAFQGGKFRRTGQKMVLELEPTPDLLAGVSVRRRADQLMVGFALEPRQELLESARAKLERKGVDMVVANPLETMDSPDIEGMLVTARGVIRPDGAEADAAGRMSKGAFAAWLVRRIADAWESHAGGAGAAARGARLAGG
jgi:phosphopantothenoylcysteine decarboxylase/phosphopantothenate--cysteine ligase